MITGIVNCMEYADTKFTDQELPTLALGGVDHGPGP